MDKKFTLFDCEDCWWLLEGNIRICSLLGTKEEVQSLCDLLNNLHEANEKLRAEKVISVPSCWSTTPEKVEYTITTHSTEDGHKLKGHKAWQQS